MKKHIRVPALLSTALCFSFALAACTEQPHYSYVYPDGYFYPNGYQYTYPDNDYHSGYFYGDPSWNQNSQFYDSIAQPIHYVP
jgi:hypothetical protein